MRAPYFSKIYLVFKSDMSMRLISTHKTLYKSITPQTFWLVRPGKTETSLLMVAPIHEVPQFKPGNKPSGSAGTGLSLRNVAISNFLFPESKENTVWKGFIDCHYFVSSLSAPHFLSFKNGFEANLRTKIDFEDVGCGLKVTQERVPLKPSMV